MSDDAREPGASDPPVGETSGTARDHDGRTPVSAPETEHALPCVCCGYDLRGLDETGRCPECSTPIRRSVVDNLLVHADHDWLKGLVMGCRVLWIGSAAIGISVALGLLLMVVMIVSLQSTAAFRAWVDLIFPPVWLVILITLTLGGIILLLGAALSTRREPRESLTESKRSPRLRAQIMLVALAIVITLHIAFRLTLPVPAGMLSYRIVFLLLLSVAAALLAHGLFQHLRGIASRVPDLDRARWCSRQARDLAILIPLANVGITLLGGPGINQGTALESLWALAGVFFAIALFIFLLRLLTLPFGLRRLHRALARERDRALGRQGAVDSKPTSS